MRHSIYDDTIRSSRTKNGLEFGKYAKAYIDAGNGFYTVYPLAPDMTTAENIASFIICNSKDKMLCDSDDWCVLTTAGSKIDKVIASDNVKKQLTQASETFNTKDFIFTWMDETYRYIPSNPSKPQKIGA